MVRFDESWGLDHGTWSVLKHVFPRADIPVVQVSIDETEATMFHYEMGNRLMSLREEGLLIIDSGNIVHNLAAQHFFSATRSAGTPHQSSKKHS